MLNFVVNTFHNSVGTINSIGAIWTPFSVSTAESLFQPVSAHWRLEWLNTLAKLERTAITRDQSINMHTRYLLWYRRHMWDCCHLCYQATSAQMTWGSVKKNSLRQHAFLQSFCSVALERCRHTDAVVDVRAASSSLELTQQLGFTAGFHRHKPTITYLYCCEIF